MKNKKLNFILLLLFTALVLFFSLKDNFVEIVTNILNMKLIWLLYALLLIFGYWFFKTLVMKIYVNYYKKDYSFKSAFNLQMKTLFFNGITPFSSGGQPFQILSLKNDGVRVSDSTNVIVITSFIHQLAIFILALLSVSANNYFKILGDSNIKNLSVFGFVINILFMLFLLALCFDKKVKRVIIKSIIKLLNKIKIVKNKKEVIDKWEERIKSLDEGAKVIKKNKKGFLLATLYNVIALISLYLVPLTIAYGMNITSFNAFEAIMITTYVDLIGMFIPIPGGTGGLEYAFVTLFGTFVSGRIVTSMMLIWRFLTYYLGMVLGGIILNIGKGNKK